MSGTVKINGQATGELDLSGHIDVARADINIPESLPQKVAVLEVRRPGQAPPQPTAPMLVLGLDLTVTAPQQIFVRGHGVDAELGGSLQVKGTSAAPQISGGFDLRRGTFSLAGQTLNFTRGRVTFDGTSPGGTLDPALSLVAESSTSSLTATLMVTGYADAPKIRLSSTPELPQDEILAQLLFGQSVKQLSPLQVAQIAQTLASLSGVGGGTDPLAMVRKGLGLDRLSVGAGSGSTTGATVEAGKYLANGIYLGAKQGTAGGTQGQVQIDLTKNLKLQTTLGTGGGSVPATGATPDNDPGSSIGLSYQFEY
jgi:translocation and assembly module TamB